MDTLRSIGKYVGVGGGILLLAATLALAQGPSSSSTKQEKLMKRAQQRAERRVQNLQKARDKAQEQMKNAQEKAKQKLAQLRDEQKQKQAKQVLDQLDRINKVWTDHFSQLLNRYDALLQKVKTRSEKAAANGHDVSGTNAALQSAETAISSARTAVTTQAQKTYTLNLTAVNSGVTSTSTPTGQDQLIKNLRFQFKVLRDQLRKDLFALRDGPMKDARTAVQKAIQTLSRVPGVDEERTATSTPANSTSTGESNR